LGSEHDDVLCHNSILFTVCKKIGVDFTTFGTKFTPKFSRLL
jgi:hypothetical protein